MATVGLQARLSYLTDAAHMLATSAPEVSAHLMSRRNFLTSNNGIPISDVEKEHVCMACGNILIPGCSATLKIESDKALRRRAQQKSNQRFSNQSNKGNATQKKEGTAQEKPGRIGILKTISCDRCGRVTEIQLPPPPSVAHVKAAQRSKLATSGLKSKASEASSVKTSANAVSKKRAKNRKAGLQALLADSKASKPSAGLSLASFMKK